MNAQSVLLEREGLDALIRTLAADGYEVLGPTVRDGAIVLDSIAGVADLPAGWTDEQAPGHYRLKRRDDAALFGYVVGPHSWRRYFQRPREPLFAARREGASFVVETPPPPAKPLALLGARGCEIAAIAIQDRVLGPGAEHPDAHYTARSAGAFVFGLGCSVAGGTCFCTSMGTGPAPTTGYDVALTELLEPGRHVFHAVAATDRGRALLARLPHAPASDADRAAAVAVTEKTARSMTKTLDPRAARDTLLANLEHKRWDDVASRCLACANCTLACPTCFCSTVEDVNDLSFERTERVRRWDSCFSLELSWVAGGNVRETTKARYRQWLTHKLATWVDQFGTSGCVGCGRCITWCPVGIDLTEEVKAMATPSSSPAALRGERAP